MQKSTLAKAISMAITGVALSAGGVTSASAGTTMYNTYTTTLSTNTDGWVRWEGTPDSGPPTGGNSGQITPWVGTSGSSPSTVLPFNYIGSSHLNWAVELTGRGDTAVISSADAVARYGFTAEIDTGGGAWLDNSVPPTGWRHQTDIGLIKSDVSQYVRINLSTVNGLYSTFGVTLFSSQDTNTAAYSHHGAWNRPSTGLDFNLSNPFGTIGLTNLGWSDFVDSDRQFVFRADAGSVYSLYLGGVGFSRWNAGVDGYVVNIITTDVPEPGTLGLFASAATGYWLTRRRKPKAALI